MVSCTIHDICAHPENSILSPLKKLAGQTATYGLSSILGRIINYLLVPLYTGVFTATEYGIYSEIYFYIAFLLVFLTFGMETTLFHFSRHHQDKGKVFSTAFGIVAFISAIFLVFCLLFSASISRWLGYGSTPEYITYSALILVLDTITALPLARLRQLERPRAFAGINLLSIGVNIGFNLFFLVYCRQQYENTNGDPGWLVKLVYDPEKALMYILVSNLLASLVKLVLSMPVIWKVPFHTDRELMRKMLSYSWPIMISGLSYILIERLNLVILKYRLPGTPEETLRQVGIFSGCYKLAIFLSLFTQAYRFAAEPFFFAHADEKEKKRLYARSMNYFVVLCCFVFLVVTLYLDFFKLFIRNREYDEGLGIVPVILIANIFLGIYTNLSMWYKFSGQTMYGVWFSLFGALLSIVLNYWLIPVGGYMAAAWITLFCYGSMMLLSYYTGKKYYYIPYNRRKILFYLILSVILYLISAVLPIHNMVFRTIVNTILLIPFIFVVIIIEPGLRNLLLKYTRNGNPRKNR